MLAVVSGTRGSSAPVYLRDLRAAAAAASSASSAPASSSLGAARWADEDGAELMGDHMHQFVLFASLDIVADRMWQTASPYLGEVDTFRDTSVSAWVAHSGDKILLLHRGFTEPAVKQLLRAVSGLWLRVSLNPLRKRDAVVVDPALDERVLGAALKCLGSGLLS